MKLVFLNLMLAPAVNVLDAITMDEQIISGLASQLSSEGRRREARLALALLVVCVLIARKNPTPGQCMQNLKPRDLACALGLILPAVSPFFPGRLSEVLRLAFHLAVLAGWSRSRLADPKLDRIVVTEYMYKLLALQSLTGLFAAFSPLLALLPRRSSVNVDACAGCGSLAMIRRQKIIPCGHFYCYACLGKPRSCGVCGIRIDAYLPS